MSRSYKKISIFGNTIVNSEKQDKLLGNRSIRRINKYILKTYKDTDFILPHKNKQYNVYKMDKDGKSYFFLKKEGEINNKRRYLSLPYWLKLMRK